MLILLLPVPPPPGKVLTQQLVSTAGDPRASLPLAPCTPQGEGEGRALPSKGHLAPPALLSPHRALWGTCCEAQLVSWGVNGPCVPPAPQKGLMCIVGWCHFHLQPLQLRGHCVGATRLLLDRHTHDSYNISIGYYETCLLNRYESPNSYSSVLVQRWLRIFMQLLLSEEACLVENETSAGKSWFWLISQLEKVFKLSVFFTSTFLNTRKRKKREKKSLKSLFILRRVKFWSLWSTGIQPFWHT